MGRNSAENQKRWREKQKMKYGEEWFEKERKRRKNYYVAATELTEKERKERRALDAARKRKSREKKRMSKSVEEEKLTVKMDFKTSSSANARLARRRKQWRALSNAKRELFKATSEKERYHKMYRKYAKRLERLSKDKLKNIPTTAPYTPRRSADKMLHDSGIKKNSKLRRTLVFHNALLGELSNASLIQKSQHGKGSVRNIIAGKVLKKYRCIKRLSSKVHISRNTLSNVHNKTVLLSTNRKKNASTQALKILVTEFYTRDDVSRLMPGKKDVKKRIQKRILNDYMSVLHAKILAENPSIRLSFSQFAKLRPANVVPVSYGSRNICLCQRHQNMALKLRGLCSVETVPTNPDKFLREVDVCELEIELKKMHGVEVQYKEWKMDTEQEKKKFKLLNCVQKLDDFLPQFLNEIAQFKEHCQRVKTQFTEMKRLKEILPDDHIIIQMDFSENYTCRSFEEVQSAYWGATGVTIHPCVVYRRGPNGNLIHNSYVVISDEMSHSSNTIISILKLLLPKIHQEHKFSFVHYWTDSPTSQYRNKYIFQVVARHFDLFGSKAVWNYFEAGHGKGACDGIGGAIKRLADTAIKRQVAVIQDSKDFYAWAQSIGESNMQFIFLSKEECEETKQKMESIFVGIRSVRGTMRVHAVYGINKGILQVSNTSCYCEGCFDNGVMFCNCEKWSSRFIENLSAKTKTEQPLKKHKSLLRPIDVPVEPSLFVGKWVLVDDEGKAYPGRVLGVDENELEVKAMAAVGDNRFFWPLLDDILWYPDFKIISVIDQPTMVTKRHMQIDPSVWSEVKLKLGL